MATPLRQLGKLAHPRWFGAGDPQALANFNHPQPPSVSRARNLSSGRFVLSYLQVRVEEVREGREIRFVRATSHLL